MRPTQPLGAAVHVDQTETRRECVGDCPCYIALERARIRGEERGLQNAMTSSEQRTSAESRGLPHREGTDGLIEGGRRNPSVSSSRFSVAKVVCLFRRACIWNIGKFYAVHRLVCTIVDVSSVGIQLPIGRGGDGSIALQRRKDMVHHTVLAGFCCCFFRPRSL